MLPDTTDTLTVSIRNTNSCAGCYAGVTANTYASDVDFDADGDYTFTWSADISGHRVFAVSGAAVNAGELRIHNVAGCADAGTLLSAGTLIGGVWFNITTGCMVLTRCHINQASDIDNWLVHIKEASDIALGEWHLTDGACGDIIDPSPLSGPAILLSDATEIKVVVD